LAAGIHLFLFYSLFLITPYPELRFEGSDKKSRVKREFHARFRERLGLKCPGLLDKLTQQKAETDINSAPAPDNYSPFFFLLLQQDPMGFNSIFSFYL
jgi:hypothetical protein